MNFAKMMKSQILTQLRQDLRIKYNIDDISIRWMNYTKTVVENQATLGNGQENWRTQSARKENHQILTEPRDYRSIIE